MSSPSCFRCGATAVIHVPYSGSHLCADHFISSVEKRVRLRIRKDGLFDGEPVQWLIGLSGGKDSAVLATILQETFAENPKISISALCIHEGIEGYRDESLEAARALAADLDLEFLVRSFESVYGVAMDNIVGQDPLDMTACAYCGVLRRGILEEVAFEIDADLVLTGHNLDDEAQTALMNFLEGDVEQIASHYDASLAPLDDRVHSDVFVPRAKPLRDVPEREIALYATLRDLPAHMTDCPHATESFRGEVQSMLYDLETDHPGTRHSILSGYEAIAEQLADTATSSETTVHRCNTCGRPASNDPCRSCELVEAIEAAKIKNST